MQVIRIALVFVALLPLGTALAQTQPQASEEVKRMCRNEILKICPAGFPPSRSKVLKCAEENKQKLPAQCVAIIEQGRR